MKILFSEHKADYNNYIFPYAIWAFPEQGEQPGRLFARGFLPATPNLTRYYLCRQVRVDLKKFAPSSENRRILRKGGDITFELIPREKFVYTKQRRDFYKNYADIKFGKDIMSFERLDALFASQIVSHVLLFKNDSTGAEIGLVTLFLQPEKFAYYYYAFYDLNYYNRNLGMFMMTSTVAHFADQNYDNIYLGSCYSRNAMYKTQFSGAQFFNGYAWSDNIKELKYLIQRNGESLKKHLLETDAYLEEFASPDVQSLAEKSSFTTL